MVSCGNLDIYARRAATVETPSGSSSTILWTTIYTDVLVRGQQRLVLEASAAREYETAGDEWYMNEKLAERTTEMFFFVKNEVPYYLCAGGGGQELAGGRCITSNVELWTYLRETHSTGTS